MTRAEESQRRSRLVFLAVVFAVAWALRLIFVLHLRGSPLAGFPVLDELYHVEWARSLAAGDWVGTEVFFRAPLYPYTLGLLFALFRGSLLAARIVQATYAALVPVAVYFLGRRLFEERESRLAAIVAALYPFFIYFSHELLIVTLIVLLDVLALLAVLRADDTDAPRRWVGAGLVLGLSAVARPNVVVFLPFLFLWMWWRARSRGGEAPRKKTGGQSPLRAATVRFALVLLGVSIVVLPVTLRNYAVGRDFVPVASQGGINFFIGNNVSSDGASAVLPVLGEAWENEDAVRIAEAQTGRTLKPSEVSGFWYERGREFLFGTPGAAARLYLRKLVLFWDRYELANNKDIYYFARMSPVFRSLSWLNFGLLAPLALLGMWVGARRNPAGALVVAFVLSYMTGVLFFFVNARFRLPVVPFLMLFASFAVFWLVRQARQRSFRALAVAVAALVLLAAFVNLDFYTTHAGDRAQTHMTLGRVRAEQGDHEGAVAEYRRALTISPNYAKALNSMGLALERLGRDDEALSAYHDAAEMDPGLASVRNNIGSLLLRRGEVDEAAAWFREAIELDAYTEQAHMNLAMILVQQGRVDEAEYHLRAAVTAEPQFTEAWHALGRLLEETGRPRDAAGAYGRAIETDPAYFEAHHDLGVLYAMAGRYEQALRELEIARRLAPGDPRIAANIAQVRELLAAGRSEGR